MISLANHIAPMRATKRVLGGEGGVSGSRREAVSSFPPPSALGMEQTG